MPHLLKCLLIADDLTGACDAAAPFADRGYRTQIKLPKTGALPSDANCGVLSATTDTRSVSRSALAHVFATLPAELPRAEIIFKKIDSTMRGNLGSEIRLSAKAFGCEAALITPAFPAMGRVVESGWLRVGGAGFEPVDMAGYWRSQRLSRWVHVRTAEAAAALESEARYISVDAAGDSDLDAIVACGLASKKKLLWAGSAGLASALARSLTHGPERAQAPERGAYPAALFCIGSTHPVTLEQLRNLVSARQAVVIAAEPGASAGLAALDFCRHIALQLPPWRITPDLVAELLDGVRAPLVLSGGDTASLVCAALGVKRILLRGELARGIPLGLIEGGPFDGMPVVTKAGGFGNPESLIEIADHFTCPNP